MKRVRYSLALVLCLVVIAPGVAQEKSGRTFNLRLVGFFALSSLLLATIGAASREPAGENVVVSMPRALLQRMGEEPVGSLSERETEIVVLAARGLSNNQIAQELNISEATVKRHLANVYEKIGVRSRSEAVRMALMEQWIGLSEITSADGDGSSGG